MVRLPFWPDGGTLKDVERGYHLPPPGYVPRTILDLGANIGLTLIDFAVKFPDAELICGIELDLANYEVACENVLPYQNILVKRCGIATWDGTCAYQDSASNACRITGAGGDTPCRTIDSVLDDHLPAGVDFMKVDIEGAEREVFKTPARWPSRVRCLSVETHYGYEPDEAMRDLTALGYVAEIHNFGPPEPGMQEHWVVWAISNL